MIYFLRAQAEADLENIAEEIALHDPAAAIRLIERLHRRWDLLTDHPLSGQSRDDVRPGARHVIVGNYITLYRIRDDGIEIVRILHGRRDLTAETAGF